MGRGFGDASRTAARRSFQLRWGEGWFTLAKVWLRRRLRMPSKIGAYSRGARRSGRIHTNWAAARGALAPLIAAGEYAAVRVRSLRQRACVGPQQIDDRAVAPHQVKQRHCLAAALGQRRHDARGHGGHQRVAVKSRICGLQ